MKDTTKPRIQWKTSTLDLAVMKPLRGHEQQVCEAVRDAGEDGMTDDELAAKLGLRHQSVSARRRELVKRGYIQNSDRTRITSSGENAIVWILGTGIPEAARPEQPSNEDLRTIIALVRDSSLSATCVTWLESLIKPVKTKSKKPRLRRYRKEKTTKKTVRRSRDPALGSREVVYVIR